MIENYLNTQGYMLFDGAFGTYYAQRYAEDQKPCEMANLNHPKRVSAIHQEYIEAGADAIKTNTFSANEQHTGMQLGDDTAHSSGGLSHS